MFRDDEIKYVVASVALAWAIAIVLTVYEIFLNRTDSVLQMGVALVAGMAAAVGATLLLLGTWEVFSMLARRINERRLAEARQEGREEERKRLEEEREEERKRLEGERARLEEERARIRNWYANLPPESKEKVPPPF